MISPPSGPLLYLDAGETPDELLATIPEIIVRRLEEVGVTRALIAAPTFRKNPLTGPHLEAVLDDLPRAVILHVFPMPRTRFAPRRERWAVPPAWLEEAAAWVSTGVAPDAEAWMSTAHGIFPTAAADAAVTLEQVRRSGSGKLVTGDVDSRIRVAYGVFIGAPLMFLGGGGPAATDDDLLRTFDELVDIGRRLAPSVGCAQLSIQPRFLALDHMTWRLPPGQSLGELRELGDRLLLDGLPWQVLGPGHLERLSQAGILPLERPGPTEGPRPLAEGRVELAVGRPADWLLDSPRRQEMQEAARELLRPCLASRAELDELLREKWKNDEEAALRQ